MLGEYRRIFIQYGKTAAAACRVDDRVEKAKMPHTDAYPLSQSQQNIWRLERTHSGAPIGNICEPFTSGGGLILSFCRKASTMSWHRTPPCAHDFSSQRRGNPGNIRRIIRPFIFPYSILPCLPKKALITGRPQWRGSPFPWWAAPFFLFHL